MTHEVTMKKGRDGWEAETTIMLPGVPDLIDTPGEPCPAFLSITTSKTTHPSGLRATAMVGYKTKGGFTTRISFMPGEGDWSHSVITEAGTRCTEKSVATLHTKALDRLPIILAHVTNHYKVADPMGENIPA